jgi:ribosomal-protein-serine acetyltransferase
LTPPADVSKFRVELGSGAELRKYSMDDLAEVWSLVDAERDRLGVWMPWISSTTTLQDQRTWLNGVVEDKASLDGCGLWAGGRYAGGVGLSTGPFGVSGELGYWVGSEFEGRGLVTLACRALIDHGFGVGLHRLFIRAGVENARSRAVAERLGFTFEGVHRGEGRGTGGFYDLACYGLLEDEWPKR